MNKILLDETLQKNSIFFMCLGFFLLIILSMFFGERIPVNHGVIGDSIAYYNLLTHFSMVTMPHSLQFYDLQRVLPIAFVFLISKIVNIPANNAEHVVFLFSVYNTLALMACVYIWRRICIYLTWSFPTQLFSFSALFINFAILKSYSFLPVMTDPSAFLAGLLIMYFFISKQRFLLLITSLLSAFIYPVVIMFSGLLLLIFINDKPALKDSVVASNNTKFYLSMAFVASIYFIFGVTYNFYDSSFHEIMMKMRIFGISVETLKTVGGAYKEIFTNSENVLFILKTFLGSIFLYFYFVYALRYSFINYLSIFRSFFTLLRITLLLLTTIAVQHFIFWYSSGQFSSSTVGVSAPALALDIAHYSTMYPLSFFVAHIVYFGPGICFCVFLWKEIMTYLHKKNTGLFLLFGFYIFFATNGETRQLANFFPILIVVISDCLNQYSISLNQVGIFIVISLFTSKFWLPVNHPEWPMNLNPAHLNSIPIHQFPMQLFFMNYGPCLSFISYLIDVAMVIAVFYLLYKTFFTQKINLISR